MSATNGERAPTPISSESDESSTATVKTTIKTSPDQVDEIPPIEEGSKKEAGDHQEHKLEVQNRFSSEEGELEDIQLGGPESDNDHVTEEDGHVEARISVEDYEDRHSNEQQEEERPKSESPKLTEFRNLRIQPDVKVNTEKQNFDIPQPLSPLRKTLHNPEFGRTTTIETSNETAEQAFERLHIGIKTQSLSDKDVIDGIFNVLVGGPFDLESRFIIENGENIVGMLNLLDECTNKLQAEIWSVFVGIIRKSFRNLEACTRVGLISICLERLPFADKMISDLLIELLSVLTNYSITVKETKHFLRALYACDDVWRRNSSKLLNVMQEMPKRDGADVFFSFPGKAGAGIVLPPLSKWPYQTGWSFSAWLRMDPLNSVNFEKEKVYRVPNELLKPQQAN